MNKWTEKLIREHTIMEITIENILEIYEERKAIIEDVYNTSGSEREYAKNMYDEIEMALKWYIKRKGENDNAYYGSEQR